MVQSKKSKNVYNSPIRRAARRLVALKSFKILTKSEWEAQEKLKGRFDPTKLDNESLAKRYEEYVARKEQERASLENKERKYQRNCL